MKIQELPEWVETEFAYPITRESFIEQAGDTEIYAPDKEDSETLSAILERSGEETYQSPDHLLTAIRGNVSDEYIGRKYYDDRSGDRSGPESDTRQETTDRSF